MTETPINKITETLAKQKQFFATNKTKDIKFRLQKLRLLKQAIYEYQSQIEQALWNDLHKSPEEAYLTEISITLAEIDVHIKNLKKWSKPKKVATPLHLKPSKSKILYEPLGVSLIVVPWNYPFNLAINPLIGAISSGCCAVVKLSERAVHIAKVIDNMLSKYFADDYISVMHGGKETNTVLFSQPFDVIFFTGSPKVGKVVMQAAAEHLTPVVLELGGKSPCIVDKQVNISIAAKRIAWGKLLNAGQTCVAPDYLLVHKSVKDELLSKIVDEFKTMYGNDAQQSRFFPRIISTDAMQRISKLLKCVKVYYGGKIDIEDKYIQPTILDEITPNSPIMQEEIFAPVLPVMSFDDINEVTNYVSSHDKPLAFYYFGDNKTAKEVLLKTTSGGACINDTIMHITNDKLPFGGVGKSGMGKYHGKDSFMAFSNSRAVVVTPTFIDAPFRYVPFKYFNLVKRIL